MTPQRLSLPPRLAAEDARSLRDALLGHRFRPLEIDGTQTLGASALALQVLVSAAVQWRADAQAFRALASSPLYRDFATLGLLFPELTQEPLA